MTFVYFSDGVSNLLKMSSVKVESFRGMARSRNYPIKGASLPTGMKKPSVLI
jgi:hypothetical protein